MSNIIRFWLMVCICFCVLALEMPVPAADNSRLNFGPPSGWVKPHLYDQAALQMPLDASADQHLLLYEQQINAAENQTFTHSVRRLISLDGIQKYSTLSIDYAPAYQSLTWHWARVWRGGHHLERLDTNNVSTVQKEANLDQFLLDGRKTAVLVLEDVQVGDIIDYAYSLKGTNPVLGGHFSAAVPVQLSEPAGRLLTRLLWPRSRHLYAKTHACEVAPATRVEQDTLEYLWDLRQMPALALEDSLPADYDPEPWVQLSEFKSWAEVNRWALALFQNGSAFSPALSAKIDAWRQFPSQEQQILVALRFVQDEVRYFGIEIGASAEKPADPSTVVARRFGDCKDKSRLFVAILRALGIEAFPVLVNSTLGRGIADWQPSAGAFDHCIAVAFCGGQAYWLDPTMNYQRGPLAAHYVPDYGCGLIIAPATTALSVIPQATGLPLTTTTEYFQLGEKSEPASLRVVTRAEGSDAEALRQQFATNKRADLEKQYAHYYSDVYPGIKTSSPLEVDDDAAENRLQITEYYSIDGAWVYSDQDHNYRVSFYPSAIAALMKAPVDTSRRMPLGISFPVHQILRTEVTLPRAWLPDGNNQNYFDSVFSFRKNLHSTGRQLVMEYEYQSLADSLPAESVPDHLQRLNQAVQSMGYTLVWP
jgi:hypothetical protein